MKITDRFLEIVKDHEMIVKNDDGLNRHLIFKNPKTSSYWFELITWRNCLCINGDIGTYTFSRIKDMFAFFRNDNMSINTGYWAEKLKSISVFGGLKVVSQNRFDSFIEQEVKDYIENEEIDEKYYKEILEQVKDEFQPDTSSIDVLYQEASNFSCFLDYNEELEEFKFSEDFYESFSVEDYSPQFINCLSAIVYGIKLYDAR